MKTDNLWVARDKDGELYLYESRPTKESDDSLVWTVDSDAYFEKLDRESFPNLKWEDDPIPVKLVPKINPLSCDEIVDLEDECFEKSIYHDDLEKERAWKNGFTTGYFHNR